MEEEINSYLKRSILSLLPRRRRSHRRAGPLAAPRNAISSPGPQPSWAPIETGPARRRSAHSGYVRRHYLACPRRTRSAQPLFRVA